MLILVFRSDIKHIIIDFHFIKDQVIHIHYVFLMSIFMID